MANKKESVKNFFEKLIEEERKEEPKLKDLKDWGVFTYICNKYYYYPDDSDNALYAIVDGPNDHSIDAICNSFTDESNPVEFVQAKYRSTFDPTTAEGEINEMKDASDKLKKMKFESIPDNIKEVYAACRENSETDECQFVYFTSAVVREDTKLKVKNQLRKGKENIEIYFGDDIQAFIQSSQMKSGRVSDGELIVDKRNNYLDYNEGSAIIVNISAESLKRLYDRYSRALLGLNLRYYVKNRNVDAGLRKTIKEHPEKFWYLNNGLVIVCSDYELDGTVLKLSDFSIVNGGQTTDRIYNTDFDTDFFIPCKVVKVDEDSEYQINNGTKLTTLDIAVATNSQKPIKDKDIVSNRKEQRILASEFRKIGIQYVTKNGDRIEKQFKDPNKHISIDSLGKLALASVMQMPWTRTGFKDLYTLDKYYYYRIYDCEQYKRNLQVYADILLVDNCYKSFIRSKIQTKNNELTKNARTIALASITFASLYIQRGVKTDIERLEKDENEEHLRLLQDEISHLDKIIVNKSSQLDSLLREFFRSLSNDVLYSPFSFENRKSGISASNYLKSKYTYFECLKGLMSELSVSDSKLRGFADELFLSSNQIDVEA